MRFFRLVASLLVAAVIAGCAATGPLYTEVASAIPPVPPSKGRIYFLRSDTIVGAAVTADIRLNGRVVGKSERGSFFYVDQEPGSCTVATATETEKQLTFVLGRGETKYVRTSVSVGLLVGRIVPELIPAEAAKEEIAGLHYTGPALARK